MIVNVIGIICWYRSRREHSSDQLGKNVWERRRRWWSRCMPTKTSLMSWNIWYWWSHNCYWHCSDDLKTVPLSIRQRTNRRKTPYNVIKCTPHRRQFRKLLCVYQVVVLTNRQTDGSTHKTTCTTHASAQA